MHVLSVVACLAVLTPLAAGEETGSLVGLVRTADGRSLPHLVLSLQGPSGPRTIVTGPDGRYRASGLAAGEYKLVLDTPGFTLSPEARATVGATAVELDLVLAPAPVREHVVVTATRSEAPLSTLGVSTAALDRQRIEAREPSTLLQLLEELPGVTVARTGGAGAQASAFLRGGESRYVRILIDGVPVNQPGGPFDLGSAVPLELERIELVRGAASSLYGSDALAGVVHVVTRRAAPDEPPNVGAEAEAGSFDGWRLYGGTSGRRGAFDWSAGLQRLETDNQQPNSAFAQSTGAASLGARLGEGSDLRLTLRAEDGAVGTPGPTAYGRPDLDASFRRNDLVLGSVLHHARHRVLHELRSGFARTNQLSLDPEDSGPYVPHAGDQVGAFPISDFPDPAGFQNQTSRTSIGYKAEVQPGARHLVTAGIDFERETGELGPRSGDLLSPERNSVGAYAQDQMVLGSRLYLTLGGRVEHNGSYGTRAVPRVAAALRLRGGPDATTLRASAGLGIKEPDFLQSFGRSFFAQGNPDLKPERSRTFDLGVEQRFFRSRLRVEATVFDHEYLDQIAYTVVDFNTFQGTFVNLGRTRARGLELVLEAAPSTELRLWAEYTLLDGEILVSVADFDPLYAMGQPLLRRPRHEGSFSARVGGDRVSVGATLRLVGRRLDSDFVGLGLTDNPGYSRLDARLRARLVNRLEAFLVGENLLDARYQEALGYPALGRALRAGLSFRTRGRRRP